MPQYFVVDRYFVRGLLCGLITCFAITSFLVIERLPPTQESNHSARNWQKELERSRAVKNWPQELKLVSDRKKILAFVGVQTGFTKNFDNPKYIYELRREALRNTWFPSSQEALDRFELEHNVVVRFVVGHSDDADKEWSVQNEEKEHGRLFRLNLMEGYMHLAAKTLAFLKAVVSHYDAKYILKIDDDVYFRLDRVTHAVHQWQQLQADYIGCMKRGPIFTNRRQRWYEPQYDLIGKEYYTHTWGTAYVLSGKAAELIASLPPLSLRFFNNEDTSVGAWMLAFNFTHYDDRRLCSKTCTESSIAVYDMPQCAGLCDPQSELLELHKQAACRGPAIPEGHVTVPLEPELIPVGRVRSQKMDGLT